jgi:ABC-type phosphate transport system substrate-binding protein
MKRKCAIFICSILLGSVLAVGCDKKDTKDTNTELTTTPTATVTPIISGESVTPSITPTPEPLDIPLPFEGSMANTISKADYPKVDGSTATIPLSEAVYQFVTGASAEEAAADIIHTKTSNSYYRLMNKEVDLLIVYEPSKQVLEDIQSGGYHLNMKPIGKDALVFMANSSNSVDSLTNKQLVDIYSGKLTNWSAVGGEDKAIQAFQRPEDSGSQTLMKKLVMKDVPMMTGSNVISFETMEGILKAMADYNNEGNTLGYSVFYYAKNMYNMPELKFMKVNGVNPSLQTIYDSSYPYINEFYAVIREEEPVNSNARRIFDWLTSEEGQFLVTNLGYVPVSMNITDQVIDMNTLVKDRIPEGYQYIGTSYSSNVDANTGTVIIYDNQWEIKKTFENAYANVKPGLVSEDALIPIGYAVYQKDGTYALRYGLYSLKEEKFVIPAIYKTLYEIDKEKGYYCVRDTTLNKVINLQGEVLASDFYLGEGFGVRRRGDYYWINTYSSTLQNEIYQIYNSDFKLVKEFENDYNQCELRENDGSVFFSKAIFLQKYKNEFSSKDIMHLMNYNETDPLIAISYGEKSMVLDRQLEVLAEKPKSTGYSSYNIYYDIFCDYNEVSNSNDFYDINGELIQDGDGNTFNNIVYDNYWRSFDKKDGIQQILYRIQNGILIVYNYNSGKQYKITLEETNNISVLYVYHDIIVISKNGSEPRTWIYKDNQLLYDLEGSYNLNYGYDFTMEHNLLLGAYGSLMNANKYIILNDKGDLLYKSVSPEAILSIDEKYIQLQRGNYWGVINYQGDYFVKAVKNDLTKD